MRFFAVLLSMVFGFCNTVQGQYDEIKMIDYVYTTNIKSVSLSPIGNTLAPAITYVGGVSLQLSFDDMDADQKDYTYDIIHCDRNWVPSDLQKQEYIDGFVNEEVDNWRFSTATFVPYTNYYLDIPNRDLSVTISGNYVLVVYEGEEDEDRIPVITRRFVVVDNKVGIETKARRPMDVTKVRSHQEFDLFVTNEDFPIIDPMLNMTVSVVQNANWNTGVYGLKPRFMVGNKMTIDNTSIVSWPGLKEFRSLDIRSLDIVSNDVEAIQLTNNGTNILLHLGYPRANGSYSSYPDADGAFIIDTKDQTSSSTQSDYGNVIFTLLSPKLETDVYVMGKFTDWQVDDTYKMEYDHQREIYMTTIEMKQGFYDYMFAVEKDGLLDPTVIEGSSYETQNFYQIFVYLREPGDRYDRVVGYAKVEPTLF